MTLVEFLSPLAKAKNQDRVLATLYYLERYSGKANSTVDEIRGALKLARVPRAATINVADVLNKSGRNVDTGGADGRKLLWQLTDSGRENVRSLLGLPAADVEIEHDVGTLQAIVDKIRDADIKAYLDEALKCLRVGALKACIVFLWSGAIRTIHNEMLAKGEAALNAAILKHDPKARAVKAVDDFAYIKDKTTLLASLDLGVFDKNQRDTLQDALDLRNRCGHPGKYHPGVKKVSAFVEDVVSIVFK
jgi:hypothetical protein